MRGVTDLTPVFIVQPPSLRQLFTNLWENAMMKLRNLVMMLTVGASMAAGSSFAGDTDFWLVNKTGYPIREIYISAAHKSQWGGDQLGNKEVMANNKSLFLKFKDRAACMQDMKVVFEDNSSVAVWENLDLCEIDKLSLKYDRATKKVTALKQ
jgi:hypothetical protein